MNRVLFIGKVWPEPASSAAGTRMMQLLRIFRDRDWQVVFACAAKPSGFNADLSAFDIESAEILLNHASFDAWIRQLKPDVVVFDRFTTEEQFGWRVAEHCPEALRILDTEDLHGLREARHSALKQGRPFVTTDLLNDVSRREIASIYRCDLSLIISGYETELLHSFFKVNPDLLFYLPMSAEPISAEMAETLPGFAERKHFISIGNFLHAPNLDAVIYLKEIWPLVRERLPEAELHVYGAYPSARVLAMNDEGSGFLVKGRAPSSQLVMRNSRVCLAPLRFGAGQKGKLLEAMVCGTPSVTTPVGAEGMHGDLPWAGRVAGSKEEVVEAAVTLYTDQQLWEESREAGRQIVNSVFVHDGAEMLYRRVLTLLQDKDAHRAGNFTGSMLMHSMHQSTRYMALWIEAKNRHHKITDL